MPPLEIIAAARGTRRVIIKRMLQGMIMGCGAPLGWILIQIMRGHTVASDIAADPLLYLYMLFGTMAVFAGFGYYVGRQEGLMQQRALRDTLTGLYNLRHFRDRLDAEITDAQRQSTPLSLIFFDLDHFKHVNDTHGHAAGDLVLVAIAHNVSGALRRNELLARIGGEEFAVLLPHTGLKDATQLAERLLEVARHLSVPVNVHDCVTVTLSLGVVELKADEDAQHFMGRADSTMYQAKEKGRNQVVAANS